MSEPDLARLLSEIDEQPSVIARLLERQAHAVGEVASAIQRRDPNAIVLVARGSSDNAAVYGRYLFEVCNRRLTSLAAPSGLTLYGSGPRLADTVVIGVSQSGRGEDVVAYVDEARRQGALTVAIVNDAGSPLAASAEHVLECLAGPELSVPATKTVTAQMMLLAMLSNALGGEGDLGGLEPLPEALQQALGQRSEAAQLARQLARTTVGSVIGRGFAFPPALEIALKLKETSYVRAEPFSAADFLHGPVALVEANYSTLLVDVGGRSAQAAAEIARAVRTRGGQPVLLRVAADPLPDELPTLGLQVDVSEPYAPIVALVLGQLLAIELARALGLDGPAARIAESHQHAVTTFDQLSTELPNPRTADIDRLDTLGILERINDEDLQVALAVRAALPRLARAVDVALEAFERGGRVVLFGAGTSGRLAMLDAVELLPTFGVPLERYLARMAGGANAFQRPIEGAEDDRTAGGAAADDLAAGDVAFGIAASGRTPWVIGALDRARERGAATIGLACVQRPALAEHVDVAIVVDTGAEAISGSTRMKAGTAQKLVLNAFSSTLMIQLGKVYGNLMVDVQATNAKLRRRAVRLVELGAGVSTDTAQRALAESDGEVKTAIAMVQLCLSAHEARNRLAAAKGRLRTVLGE